MKPWQPDRDWEGRETLLALGDGNAAGRYFLSRFVNEDHPAQLLDFLVAEFHISRAQAAALLRGDVHELVEALHVWKTGPAAAWARKLAVISAWRDKCRSDLANGRVEDDERLRLEAIVAATENDGLWAVETARAGDAEPARIDYIPGPTSRDFCGWAVHAGRSLHLPTAGSPAIITPSSASAGETREASLPRGDGHRPQGEPPAAPAPPSWDAATLTLTAAGGIKRYRRQKGSKIFVVLGVLQERGWPSSVPIKFAANVDRRKELQTLIKDMNRGLSQTALPIRLFHDNERVSWEWIDAPKG